jgi:hypothetical protein
MVAKGVALAVFTTLVTIAVAALPARTARAEPGDDLRVYVMTMGPGDHPFFKFGHNAIWVQDRTAGTSLVYNFGTFRFDSPKLIPEFMRGRLMYWLSVSSIDRTTAAYQKENRTIEVQELDLPAAEKEALAARLADNALPEKRAYKYDYFLDNCSTRVRDAVDKATGGRLRAASTAPARMTLRAQALRMTADLWWEYLALHLILGPSTDLPGDRWGEMFIPQELARGLRAVSLQHPTGVRPLVKSQEVTFRAQRDAPLDHPPERGVTLLLAGLGLGVAFAGFGLAGAVSAFLRVIFGAMVALWGLAVGFIGCFLSLVWAFTDHVVAARNENILQCAPFAIALAILGWGVAAGRSGATKKAFVVAVASAVLSAAGALCKLHPMFRQDNGSLIGLFLPAWFGLFLGLATLRRALPAQSQGYRSGSRSGAEPI